ncbi:MAG: peptide ABC transporter permease [Staphylococcus rostri]|uniref:peptide ABC transporter permease n=1 Tax=Staphylococcus rostri TaxID=522262 RepID=UPI0026DF368E|nr:peptide ABC transporter permease [Staphylococcus rostri]MDO5374637.1 peptide ABC transporter permease [Staphylococcus rostri]
MKLEIKKSLSNKIVLSLGVLFLFLFLLGYFLPVGIDKVTNLSYGHYFFSAYTVATEFGFLLFSFVIAYFINKEYANKNTLFYRLIGNNVFSFFYKKAAVLFIESFVFVVVIITIVSLIYGNFSHYLLLIILFSLVILQYIIIIGTVSIVSPNVLISIGISIVYWIGSIVLVAINKHVFGFLAPFEASNSLYKSVEKVLSNQASSIVTHDITTIVIFFIVAVAINFIVLALAKKRWLKLGM